MGNVRSIYTEGYEGKSVTGESFIVVDYKGRKNITIRFDCGLEKNTTSTLIKQGKVTYSKRAPKYEIGMTLTSILGIEGEIIDLDRAKGKVKLKFKNGNVKTYSLNTIGSRTFNDEDTVKIKIGDIFSTNNHGDVEVVEYINAYNVRVKFSDSVETLCHASSLRSGNVGHPTSGLYIGYQFTNNEGFTAKVIEYLNPLRVKIEWNEGGITEAMAANIKSGSVYYPNQRSICGVGYFGIGKYKPNKSGRNKSNYNQRVYDSWQRMIRRCYDEKEQQKPSYRAYIGVKVCEDWYNFQNFATWAEDKLDKFEKGWELDKDMFGDGLLYSPETCTMLPERINWFLCNNYSNKVSGLPEGVNVVEPKYPNAKVGYVARCHIDGKREYLGYYNTSKEAGDVYRSAKEGEARRLAYKYKDVLTEEQYIKLMSFTLEDIHRKQAHMERPE